MAEALTWLVVLLIIACGFWSLVRENNRQRNRSAQEYERDLADTRNSLLRAGMIELNMFAGNEREKRAAVEYIKDVEKGITKTGGKDDDVDRTAGQR
jgi:ABC-type nickel/cobalt efflux system permease component RcnA